MLGFLWTFLKRAALSKITTGIILPFLATAPVLLIAQAGTTNAYPPWLFDPLNQWLKDYPQGRLLSWWPLVLIPVSYVLARIRDWLRGHDDLEQKELLVLQRMLDRPVGQKLIRFGKVAKRLSKKGGEDAGAVFREITQPEIQIALLVESLYMFFLQEVESKEELKVTLARMKRAKIESFECFLPHGSGPKSNAATLQSPEATVNRAAKLKKPIVVADIAAELRKKKNRQYAPGSGGSGNEGSMICYPVIDPELPNDVPFVITIKYFQKNHFTVTRRRRYEFVLQRFSERIAMENRLRIIKEATL